MDIISKYIKKLAQNGDHSSSTLRSYSSDLRRLGQYVFNHQDAQQQNGNISVDQLLMFLDAEYKSGYKPSTLHRRKVSLMQFAEFLLEDGIFNQNDIRKLSEWKPEIWNQIKQRELQFLSENEVNALYDAILSQNSARMYRDISIISLVLETGLSIDPIIKLNVADLQLRKKQLRIGGADEDLWYSIKASVKYLQKYLELSRPELTQSTNEEALFVSQMGSRITRQGIWQLIKSWGEKSGLSTPLSPRVLRHTSVMKMLNSGRTAVEIQKLLGHTNIFSTKALIRKLEKSKPNELYPEVEI